MYTIDENPFSISLISKLISNKTKLALSKNSIDKIVSCRDYLNHKIESSKAPIYGINTGFGSLYNVKISSKNLKKIPKETKPLTRKNKKKKQKMTKKHQNLNNDLLFVCSILFF